MNKMSDKEKASTAPSQKRLGGENMKKLYEKYRSDATFRGARVRAEASGLTEQKPVVVVFQRPDMCRDLVASIFESAKTGEALRVETNQEIVLHHLRLKAATDPCLMKNVVVLFDDGSGERKEVSLREEDELDWPKDLLMRGIDIGMEIREAQRAAQGKKIKLMRGCHKVLAPVAKKPPEESKARNECTKCKGRGTVDYYPPPDGDPISQKRCSQCDGTGLRSSSEPKKELNDEQKKQ